MEIVPKLDLNRNPKEVKCGSLIAAKNVMTDDSGSYFTNEYGFGVSFETNSDVEDSDTFNHPSEYIVGVIPCNKEIVIFTYSAYEEKLEFIVNLMKVKLMKFLQIGNIMVERLLVVILTTIKGN